MAETVIHSDGGDSPITDVAHDLGKVEGAVEAHADKIENHAEKLTNLGDDAEWTKDRLGNLERMVMDAPGQMTAAVSEEINHLRSSLTSLTEKVESLVSAPAPENTENTSAPAETENKATEKKSLFGGLGRALHRIL